jgi:hypothetical protein
MKPTVSVKGFRKQGPRSLVQKNWIEEALNLLLKPLPPKEKKQTVEVTKDLLSQLRDRIDLNQIINFGRGQKKGR